jgi:hypothetical protein
VLSRDLLSGQGIVPRARDVELRGISERVKIYEIP